MRPVAIAVLCAACSCLSALVTVGVVAPGEVAPGDAVPAVIEAQRFILRDADGVERAELRPTEDGAILKLFRRDRFHEELSEQADPVVFLSSSAHGGRLEVRGHEPDDGGWGVGLCHAGIHALGGTASAWVDAEPGAVFLKHVDGGSLVSGGLRRAEITASSKWDPGALALVRGAGAGEFAALLPAALSVGASDQDLTLEASTGALAAGLGAFLDDYRSHFHGQSFDALKEFRESMRGDRSDEDPADQPGDGR